MTYRINHSRSGFTLIELMIVIAIIALLMSILGVAVMNSFSGAKVAATKQLMVKIQRQLQSRIEALRRMLDREKGNEYSRLPFLQSINFTSAANIDGTTPQSRIKAVRTALIHKYTHKTYLPQTWSEASYLLALVGKTAPSPNPETESAEVLYFFLTDSSIIGYTPINADLFTGNEVRDTDGNGFPELVDYWGKPLRFYRWPTRLLRPTGFSGANNMTPDNYQIAIGQIEGIPANLASPSLTPLLTPIHDPDDPMGVLTPGKGWITVAEAADVENGTNPFNDKPFPLHTLFTWHTPLVVSAGVDQDFGIYESIDTGRKWWLCEPKLTPQGITALNNNITNLNVKSGGN
jgi:prepilin-type N-terminal cleavage/methylation domain-containing protein